MKRRLPVPSDRTLRVLKWIVVAAVVLAILGCVAAFTEISHRLDAADRDRADLAEYNASQDDVIAAQKSALEQANRRLREAGENPVSVPESPEPIPGPAGETGERGERGPAGPAGASIVGPRGPAGDDGTDGRDGTEGSDGQAGAKGDTGATGPAGAAGRDGTDGKNATPEMVATAVEQWCNARGDCLGPQGLAGPAGPQGPQGVPGVVDVATSPECATILPGMALSLAYDPGAQIVTLVCA